MFVYRSNRIETLAGALADCLREHSGDPIVPERVVVASMGMERWLRMELARRLGVCANCVFPFPAAAIHGLIARTLDDDGALAEAWAPDRLAWSILKVQEALDAGGGAGKALSRERYQRARLIADVFDSYLTFRQAMVVSWEEGGGEGDWQPVLWRVMHREVGLPHLAERAREFFARIGEHPPEGRIFLFGVSTLPPFFVEVLEAASRTAEVHLFTLTPCREFFADIRDRRDVARTALRTGEDPSDLHLSVGNPLLASFGRLTRDFQAVLEDACAGEPYQEPAGDLFQDPGTGTMLATLQSDILNLRWRGRGDDPACGKLHIADDDSSFSIHSCAGPSRQVEVLRDLLLCLFNEDRDLEPRDVIVMTPDIETFAPLIEATFSDGSPPVRNSDTGIISYEPAGFPAIPFHVADRGLRGAVADCVPRVLALARSRVTATDVLDLIALPAVQRRFGLGPDDMGLVAGWVRDSGIRWGIDKEHRVAEGLPPRGENTWRFGLDRLLLGYAMPGGGGRQYRGVYPYDEVEGTIAGVMGRFADFAETLMASLSGLRAPRPMAEWRKALLELLDGLVTAGPDEGRQLDAVRDAIVDAAGLAEAAGYRGPVEADTVRVLVERALDAPRAGGGFLAGAVTFCAMVPMRSIPHRVVVLLGMDDGAFPRLAHRPAFDLVAAHPRAGDRDPRSDDQQIFLEAILSARERLIVLFTGRNPRDNTRLSPAVPVCRLLEVIEESFEGPVRDRVAVEHPLQPFSPANFRRAAIKPGERSFSAVDLVGARALTGPRNEERPFVSGVLPDPHEGMRACSVEELARFFENPSRHLLTRGVGVRLTLDDETLDDREPVEMDDLARWEIGDTALRARTSGQGMQAVLAEAAGRGCLPLGTPGRVFSSDLAAEVEPIVARAYALREGEARSVRVDLGASGMRLTGTIGPVFDAGLVRQQFARVKPRDLVAFWARHVVLAAAGGEAPVRGHLVGRPAERSGGFVTSFLPLGRDAAGARENASRLLEAMTGLYLEGMRAPLPFFPATSLAFVTAVRKGASEEEAVREAGKEWRKSEHADGNDPYVARLFGDGFPFADDPRAAYVALMVWGPLLDHLIEDGQ